MIVLDLEFRASKIALATLSVNGTQIQTITLNVIS